MAAVSLLNVTSLSKDLEWKLTYVGSATSSEHDQELDSLLVGPIPVGVNKFVFEADAPDRSRIPDTEILGVTVILLTCSYDGREFVRVGYYVNNEYTDESLIQDPPQKPIVEKVQRNILAEKPRVTRFAIKWDSEESAPAEFPPEQPDADAADDDGAQYGAEEEEEEEVEGVATEQVAKATGEDAEMAEAAEVEAAAKADDDASDAGSEDLEAESSGSDDDEDEDEEGEGEGEGEGNADEEMTDGQAPATSASAGSTDAKTEGSQPRPAPNVMVH